MTTSKISANEILMLDSKLAWHLSANVLPQLTDKTIQCIIGTYNDVLQGKRTLDETINENTDCTIGEMFDDLKIELPAKYYRF